MNRMTKCAEWQSLFIEFHASANSPPATQWIGGVPRRGEVVKNMSFLSFCLKKSASFSAFRRENNTHSFILSKKCATRCVGKKEKRWLKWISVVLKLSYQDSNLDRQNQKLQCYHYTIRQSLLPKTSVLKRCKGTHNIFTVQIFLQLFSKYFFT